MSVPRVGHLQYIKHLRTKYSQADGKPMGLHDAKLLADAHGALGPCLTRDTYEKFLADYQAGLLITQQVTALVNTIEWAWVDNTVEPIDYPLIRKLANRLVEAGWRKT